MWAIIFTLVGTFIGAGFVSGKEVYVFFYRFGLNGLIGIAISCLTMGFIIYQIFKIINRKNISSYDEFLTLFFKNNKIKNIIKHLINTYLLISFCIMVAGFTDFLKQEFILNKLISFFIINIFCFYIFSKNIKEITKINSLIIPICVVFIAYVFIKNINVILLFNGEYLKTYINSDNCFMLMILYSFLYANYNLLTIIPLIIEMNKIIIKKKNIKYIAIIFSIITAILSFIIFLFLLDACCLNRFDLIRLQMPMCGIVGMFKRSYKIVYSIIICIAITTTAIASGFGYIKNNGKYIYLFCLSLLFIQIDFSNLIAFFYPVFGVLGIIQNIKIIKSK